MVRKNGLNTDTNEATACSMQERALVILLMFVTYLLVPDFEKAPCLRSAFINLTSKS